MSPSTDQRGLSVAFADVLDPNDRFYPTHKAILQKTLYIVCRLAAAYLPLELRSGKGISAFPADHDTEMSEAPEDQTDEAKHASQGTEDHAWDGNSEMSSDDDSVSLSDDDEDLGTSFDSVDSKDEEEYKKDSKSEFGNGQSPLRHEVKPRDILKKKYEEEKKRTNGNECAANGAEMMPQKTIRNKKSRKDDVGNALDSTCTRFATTLSQLEVKAFPESMNLVDETNLHKIEGGLIPLATLERSSHPTFKCLVCSQDITDLQEPELYNHVLECLMALDKLTYPTCDTDVLESFKATEEVINHIKSCMRRIVQDNSQRSAATREEVEMSGSEAKKSVEELYGDTPLPAPEPMLKYAMDAISDWEECDMGDSISETEVDQTHLCALCGFNAREITVPERVDHFNDCWSLRGIRIFTPRTPFQGGTPRLRARSPPRLSRPSPFQENKDFLQLPNMPDQTSTDVPKSSCPFCFKNLSDHRVNHALQHRAMCLHSSSRDCPICTKFLSMEGNERQDSLWHLQNCQAGTIGNESWFEKDDFEGLYASRCAMTEVMEKVVGK
ncbi:hypothetical protein K458DRAFT_391245 [Lentithecium fluviatile CBS 122367]|uniref:Uncharacterized protein n=1 Tax=Lentithecium fluviatile CBS 122367 TaxID=1168545 RepID=A0A6G1IWF7_9PLEO|nr:hypothetical protein K458DRAFT_391245 [Lentithecium fluviatile CBS 122367]